MCKGIARAFPRFCFALHLLHSRLRVLVDPCSSLEWHPDVMAPAIWMFGGGECDCDPHESSTGTWDRGEMVSRFRSNTFGGQRIVLYPFSIEGCDPNLQFQSRSSECKEFAWILAACQPAQSAFLWSLSCICGSQGRGFHRKALHGQCNSWTRASSLRNRARGGGIGGVSLVCRNAAATCGTGTRLAFLVGVSARGSPTLSPPFYVNTSFQLKL